MGDRSSEGAPPDADDIPNVPPPRDLHPTSDIRFVIMEVATLTAKVDRLIEDVKEHGNELKAIDKNLNSVKGGFRVLTGVVLFVGFLISFGDKIVTALKALLQ